MVTLIVEVTVVTRESGRPEANLEALLIENTELMSGVQNGCWNRVVILRML
jgi:hypothetical protein